MPQRPDEEGQDPSEMRTIAEDDRHEGVSPARCRSTKTAQAMRASLSSGDLLEVYATDPGSVSDFAAWCKTTGHELVGRTEDDGMYRFVISKR